MEDGVLQLQETDEDVEGLEEEAVCLTDVLILSVYQEQVFLCQPDNRRPSFDFHPDKLWLEESHPHLVSLHSLYERDHYSGESLCLNIVEPHVQLPFIMQFIKVVEKRGLTFQQADWITADI